jgi:predicted transcriptional regulator
MRQLTEIKRLRRKYNLSQKDLAFRSGVSQSLIAKVESGKVEPTYTKTIQLFDALEELRKKDQTRAKDLMNHDVITVDINDHITQIITIMKKSNFSQIPVLSNGKVCGLITESTILEKMLENSGKIAYLSANDLMEDAPPIIPREIVLQPILSLLQTSPMVLVMHQGELQGIICKSDVLEKIE